MFKNNQFVLNTILEAENFPSMKVKNLLLFTVFLVSFGLSYSRSAIAGAECGDRYSGWQLGCVLYGSGKIEISNKSGVGVWFDIKRKVARDISDEGYFNKRILLPPGKSELVEFGNLGNTSHNLEVLNCATEQDANAPIRCPSYLDIKSF